MPTLSKSRMPQIRPLLADPDFAAGRFTAAQRPNAFPIVVFCARIAADHAVSADRIAGAGQNGPSDQDTAQAPKAWAPFSSDWSKSPTFKSASWLQTLCQN